ncbi:MAG TPA: hypothetical protein VIX42_09770 [Edaphobacter sp.]
MSRGVGVGDIDEDEVVVGDDSGEPGILDGVDVFRLVAVVSHYLVEASASTCGTGRGCGGADGGVDREEGTIAECDCG